IPRLKMSPPVKSSRPGLSHAHTPAARPPSLRNKRPGPSLSQQKPLRGPEREDPCSSEFRQESDTSKTAPPKKEKLRSWLGFPFDDAHQFFKKIIHGTDSRSSVHRHGHGHDSDFGNVLPDSFRLPFVEE